MDWNNCKYKQTRNEPTAHVQEQRQLTKHEDCVLNVLPQYENKPTYNTKNKCAADCQLGYERDTDME